MQIPSVIGYYAIGDKIGEGNYAEVKSATHQILDRKVALKIINKKSLCSADIEKIHREVKIMKVLHHPNIIRLYQVMEHKNLLYMVTEYASGGELFSYLSKHHTMSEDEARNVFSQLLCALEYCHAHNVVHRDIKLENLLLDNNGNVKLADFGFSNFFSWDGKLSTWCGSPSYAAPEIFEGREYIGPEVDIWSAGVVLYTLVSGCLPFDGVNVQELKQRVIKCLYRLHFRISEECGDIISKMVIYEPSKRYTIPKIRTHTWMAKSEQPLTKLPGAEEISVIRDHVVRKLKSNGVDWHSVLEASSHRKFDDLYAMYSILEDQYLSESRNANNVPPPVRAETRALPSVGFPELRQQQETLKQARDWTRSDLAKVPSSLSSRSSFGSFPLEPLARTRTTSGDAQLALHQQYLNYRRHSLDIFTFQNNQNPNHLTSVDAMKPMDLLSNLRARDFAIRRASDSITLQSLQYPLVAQRSEQNHADASYNVHPGQHNFMYYQHLFKSSKSPEKELQKNAFLSSVPHRMKNHGRRFSDGLIIGNKGPNLHPLQELPGQENDSEEMLPIPTSFQLSPRQPPRRHSFEPSILTPRGPGSSGNTTSIQQHLESLYEQALCKKQESDSSSSDEMSTENCNQQHLGSRLMDMHIASNNVEQWQSNITQYMGCMDVEPNVSPEIPSPRQVADANLITDQSAAEILKYVETYLQSCFNPAPCLNTEGYVITASWNELELKAEVCSVGCRNALQVHHIRGDHAYYKAVTSQLLSSFQT